MNRRLLLGAGVGAVAVAAGAGYALRRSQGPDPAFWQLSFDEPGGGKLTMASLRGRPFLLNFWATWCAPCIKEMPLLDQFHRSQGANGWQVVGIAVDGPTPVREYLAKVPVGFPIGLAGMEGAELSRTLGNLNGSLPFTVVFGADGVPMAQKLGAVTPSELQDWVRRAKT
jgi:thiol-disulfide isomerase/thioredoxin